MLIRSRATEYPGQVQCIFLRNTSNTDPGDRFPYNTDGFKDLNTATYMFFRTPDDLMNLDIANGDCVNRTFAQNITFSYQGLPFGLSDDSSSDSGNAAGSIRAQGGTLVFWSILAVVVAISVAV
jgi:hypothetical protein